MGLTFKDTIMDFKEQLSTLIDAVIAGNDNDAKAAFHAYSVARTSALVTEGEKGVNPFAKKDKEDKEDDKDEDKDSKKSDKEKDDKKSDKEDDDKEDDKDDKKKGGFVPFKKKDKKDDE